MSVTTDYAKGFKQLPDTIVIHSYPQFYERLRQAEVENK